MDRLHRLRRDPAADTHFHSLPFLLQELLQQKRGTQFGMKHAHQLESNTVVPAEIQRQSRRVGPAEQADCRVIPSRVNDLCRRHLPMRDLARRKHREHAALL